MIKINTDPVINMMQMVCLCFKPIPAIRHTRSALIVLSKGLHMCLRMQYSPEAPQHLRVRM